MVYLSNSQVLDTLFFFSFLCYSCLFSPLFELYSPYKFTASLESHLEALYRKSCAFIQQILIKYLSTFQVYDFGLRQIICTTSVLLFPQLQNGDNNSMYIMVVSRFNEIVCVKCLVLTKLQLYFILQAQLHTPQHQQQVLLQAQGFFVSWNFWIVIDKYLTPE